jgi:hypothetical protein
LIASNLLPRTVAAANAAMHQQLASADRMTLGIDGYTSINNQPVFSVTVTTAGQAYVYETFQLSSDPHTGARLAGELALILQSCE